MLIDTFSKDSQEQYNYQKEGLHEGEKCKCSFSKIKGDRSDMQSKCL